MTQNKSIIMRILHFAKPFTWLFLFSILLNSLFSAFSALSISMVNPIVQILFSESKAPAVAKTVAVNHNPLTNVYQEFYGWILKILSSPEGLVGTLVNLSIFLIIIFVIKNIFKYYASLVGCQLQEGLIKSIRDKAFQKLSTLSIDFFKRNKEGGIISILTNDTQAFNQNTIMIITLVIRDFLSVLIFLFLLLSISPKLLLISLTASLGSLLILRFSTKYLRRYASRMQTAMADYTSTMQESIAGIRIVKAYNAEEFINTKFESDSKRFYDSSLKNRVITALIPGITESMAIFALALVILVGGTDVVNGTMRVSDLMTFLFAFFAVMSPISELIGNMTRFQHGFVAAGRVFTIMDEEPTVIEGKESISTFSKSIDIENVSFKYQENNYALKDVSFSLPRNKKIALVGASGSGKSTMLDLIIRFYDPTGGRISIDGRDLRNLDSKSFRKFFGVVSQETILFNDTVANNIRYGMDEISQEDVISAAQQANAYNFIMNMPNGFETIIGNRGSTLSGGERQRIAIARALVRNPEILIFDEATSALDAESEKVVQEAIDSSLLKKTAVIVAHRLSTITSCDVIYVFDQGSIVESGTHRELIEKDGYYRKLYDIQFRT
ncbi:MAG: ABC transporter ATP-binding protein [bacterium]